MSDALDELAEYFEKLKNAKPEPSPACQDGGTHDFKAIAHSDGQDSYSWTFECQKCGEVVEKVMKRTGRY